MKLKLLISALALCGMAFGQASRFDSQAWTTATLSGTTGMVKVVPGATVAVCTYPAAIFGACVKEPLCPDSTLVGCLTASNPVTADASGNFGFWVAPGKYDYWITAFGVHAGPYHIVVAPDVAVVNGVFYAGPGSTPTIDTQVAACPSSPCTVVITPGYTGSESSNLFTTSTGYKVYSGPNNVTIVDYRANAAAAGSPADAPLYPIIYGGRSAGALNRVAINYWSGGTIPDSTGASSFFNWVSGTFPSNSGQLAGLFGVVQTHDAVTIGGSGSVLAGADFEGNGGATSSDAPLGEMNGLTASGGINRANSTQNITKAIGVHGKNCQNASTVGATITNCYAGFFDNVNGGTAKNFALGLAGNMGMVNESQLEVLDSGGTYRTVDYYRNTNVIEHRPLSDANGHLWASTAGGSWFGVNSTTITSYLAHNFAADARPNVDNIGFLGGSAKHWAGLYLTRCASATSPAVCGGAATGFVNVAAAATTVVVNTTQVSALSTITLTRDNSLGSALSATCNTQSSLVLGTPYVSARSTGVSFTIAVDLAPTTNPLCVSYSIVN